MSQSFRKHVNKSFYMLEWLHTIPSYLLNQLQGTAQPSARHGVLNSAGHMTGTILTISHFPFCLALSIQSPIFRSHTIQQGMHRDASQAGGIVHLTVILCFPLSSKRRYSAIPLHQVKVYQIYFICLEKKILTMLPSGRKILEKTRMLVITCIFIRYLNQTMKHLRISWTSL